MAFLRGFGHCLPGRVVDNVEIGALTGADPAWILQASGIEQRRFAGDGETVASLGAGAAQDCLSNCGAVAKDIGLILMSSGSTEQRFPGPASEVGTTLGIG